MRVEKRVGMKNVCCEQGLMNEHIRHPGQPQKTQQAGGQHENLSDKQICFPLEFLLEFALEAPFFRIV